MPNDTPATGTAAPVPQPSASLPPAERSRLLLCFQHGTQSVAKNIDYAIEMFAACVLGDPANAIFLQHLIGALRMKHGGKKGGGLAALWSASGRGGLKKLAAAGKWRDVLTQGLAIIKANPSDQGSILVMAEACRELGYVEAQRVYLKAALDAAPADVEVNRECARFLESHGEFDQAIACWMRIKAAKGMADEAEKEITRLQVDKTFAASQGMIGRKPAGPTGAKPTTGGPEAVAAEPPAGVSPGERKAALEKAIAANPADIQAYLDLADVVEQDGTLEQAERLLEKALAASGNDVKVREHLEDRQIRWAKGRLHVAERRLGAEDTPEHRAAVERLRATLLKHETDIYAARAARYPENLNWKYELAVRLKAAGNHAEAIKHFQDVLVDARRKGVVSLELGECFQKIRQYQLAMRSYQTAVDSLTDREPELRKRALYRAGVLAAGLDDVDAARKYLSTLAELDFGYRDVAQRLDKLTPAKDKGAGA
jgi:tetratricopeptide (TPR) repeat protein